MPSNMRQICSRLPPTSILVSPFTFSGTFRPPNPSFEMKKSGLLAASVAAASAAAVSASSSSSTFVCNSKVQFPHQEEKNGEKSSSSAEKFAPNFDGLRFIETLVTAHR